MCLPKQRILVEARNIDDVNQGMEEDNFQLLASAMLSAESGLGSNG